jgi:hypothetical protein
MNTEEQSRSECTMPPDKGDHKDSPAQPRTLTWKQLQLAEFIAQEGGSRIRGRGTGYEESGVQKSR